MPIFNLFSKRQKKFKGGKPDVYVYDDLPRHFRVQVVHIVRDAIGTSVIAEETYGHIHQALCREYGVFTLKESASSHAEAVFEFFLNTSDVEKAIDAIELFFLVIYSNVNNSYGYDADAKIKPNDAIEELNCRFKEHGIGYQFESNKVVRIDSRFIHSEAVKPAVQLLQNEMYKGANDEFLKAHEHYRNQRNKECINECLKSLESLMKSICDKHNWNYSPNDTSQKLIDICLKNGLIPQYLQCQFSSLRSLLESGVPTIRNKLGGHGQGATTVTVNNDIASYCLHLTASSIVFFIWK